jgi:hypothetical protein
MLANHKNMSTSENSSTKTPLSVVKFLELVRQSVWSFAVPINANLSVSVDMLLLFPLLFVQR